MARVVRMDTQEDIGYFVDLYGPLEPGTGGWSFDAWAYPDGSLRAERPSSNGNPLAATRWKIWMPVEHPEKIDCVLLVTPTYLDFMAHIRHSGRFRHSFDLQRPAAGKGSTAQPYRKPRHPLRTPPTAACCASRCAGSAATRRYHPAYPP